MVLPLFIVFFFLNRPSWPELFTISGAHYTPSIKFMKLRHVDLLCCNSKTANYSFGHFESLGQHACIENVAPDYFLIKESKNKWEGRPHKFPGAFSLFKQVSCVHYHINKKRHRQGLTKRKNTMTKEQLKGRRFFWNQVVQLKWWNKKKTFLKGLAFQKRPFFDRVTSKASTENWHQLNRAAEITRCGSNFLYFVHGSLVCPS